MTWDTYACARPPSVFWVNLIPSIIVPFRTKGATVYWVSLLARTLRFDSFVPVLLLLGEMKIKY